MEDAAERLVGEGVRVVLAEEHIARDGEHLRIPAVEPRGDLHGREEAAAVLRHIVLPAQELRHGQPGDVLANQPLNQPPDARGVLMIVA